MINDVEIERAARQLCKEMGHCNPDMLVHMGMPQFFNNGLSFGYVIPKDYEQIPIWMTFRQFIKAAARIIENQNA